MKNKIILPFALSTLVAALGGCGGESAKVNPEIYDTSTTNGTCLSNSEGCVEFVLDYPVEGLNFNCSSDVKNTYVTLFDLKEGVSTGACKIGDKVTFFIQGEKSKRIDLGTVDLKNISQVASGSTPPRLTLVDLATGITGKSAASISSSDATIKVAMRIAKIIQALAIKNNSVVVPTDIQAVYINNADKLLIDEISRNVTTADFSISSDTEFDDLFKPWLDLSQVSNANAFTIVSKLMTISTAAVYQPEFALFSTDGVLANASGSNGLVGCDKNECLPSDSSKVNLFGHFMLMTDRQGMTFGSGLQWKGKVDEQLSTIGGVNVLLLTQVKPTRLTATPQDTWVDPLTKEIDTKRNLGFRFDAEEVNADPLIIKQGTLLADKMVVGTGGSLFKTLQGKKDDYVLTADDKKKLGLWEQKINQVQFKGTMDLYKLYSLSYLDKKVFKSIDNVVAGQNYIFPLYADLTFKFTDTTVKTVKLGVVIDRNGDIRTNIKPGVPADVFTRLDSQLVDISTDSAKGCQGKDVLDPLLMKDDQGVQQYRLGTTTRTFTPEGNINPNTISIRMIMADPFFGTLDGALIGMNSSVKTSADTSLVVGGALVQLHNLINATEGSRPTGVALTDSDNKTVKWGNSLASFSYIYSLKNPNDTTVTQISKLNGGEISLDLAPCYSIQKK
ncbi:hypothetical protein B9T33_09200 [Acinetobacter sp. ANC 5054]|uniref:putative pilus system protein FilF n=1 Tax=Acinetobacter sp. ANC 5054 TaxID=1977877 RepID=UPI000A332C29|nr:hypothetical protein [Acinetobacter sp. ANC 5054]OTG80589.1 hypothetical protein B9T33_09200 [Acinetobacter sp. ANC 5054]